MTHSSPRYLEELRRRAKESRVYRKYQLFGLSIAETLKDERHKALYIKLAKERGGEMLLAIAKDVALRRHVKNRGAYFMALLKTSDDGLKARKRRAASRRQRSPKKHSTRANGK